MQVKLLSNYKRRIEMPNEIVAYIKGQLEELEPNVIGCERSNDIYDCGYSDGTWNAYIEILEELGIKHDYPKQY